VLDKIKPNLLKENKNIYMTLLFASWWANPTHHGFNPDEPGSTWAESKINPY